MTSKSSSGQVIPTRRHRAAIFRSGGAGGGRPEGKGTGSSNPEPDQVYLLVSLAEAERHLVWQRREHDEALTVMEGPPLKENQANQHPRMESDDENNLTKKGMKTYRNRKARDHIQEGNSIKGLAHGRLG